MGIRTSARLCIYALSVFACASANASVIHGPVVNPANGHTYFLLEQSPWTEAEAIAVSMGGHLATIRNRAENDWVFNTFGDIDGIDRSLWIGLNDAASEGEFVWVSGESSSFRLWGNNQPDDYQNEDYVHMMRVQQDYNQPPRRWNDMDDVGSYSAYAPYHGIVEIIPEPAGLLLLAPVMARRHWNQRQRGEKG